MAKMYCGTCMAVQQCRRKEVYDKRGIVIRVDWECAVCGSADIGAGILETENENAEWIANYLRDIGSIKS